MHFASTGSDVTGDGSISAPYQTVVKANALLAATAVGGDELRFNGGDSFTDAVLTVTGKAFTTPVVLTSYGTGRATLAEGTAGANAVTLTGSSNIIFRNINVLKPIGVTCEAPNDVYACLTVSACSNVWIEDVDCTGSARGVQVSGASGGVFCKRVISRNAWVRAFYVAGTTVFTGEDLEAQFAGYDATFAVSTAVATSGRAFHVEGTATVQVRRATVVNPKNQAIVAGQTVNRAHFFRLRCTVDRNDRTAGVVTTTSTAGLTLHDSALRLTKTSGAGTFKHFEVAAAAKLRLANVSVYDDHRTGTVTCVDYAGAELKFDNCLFYMAAANTIVSTAGGATAPVCRANDYYIPNPGMGYFPFIVNAVNTAYAGWAAAYETGSYNVNPQLANSQSPGLEVLRLAVTSPLLGLGVDLLLADYSSFSPTDVFGTPRIAGSWTQWSIGAHEPTPATLQSFLEGGGYAKLDSASGVASYASLRVLPPFVGFPAYTHYVQATVKPTLGIKRAGVWLLGGPVGGFSGQPSQPFSATPYSYTFSAAGDQALEAGGYWDVGATPGENDPRRIVFELLPDPNVTTPSASSGIVAVLRGAIPSGDGPTFNFSSTTGTLTGVVYGTAVVLRLHAAYLGRVPQQGKLNYRYAFTCSVNGVAVIAGLQVTLPEEWVDGFGIADAVGAAGYVGIVGERSTFSGALTLTTPTWTAFDGVIEGDLGALPLPTPAQGEARVKYYLAARDAVTNRALNGGFTAHAGLYDANYAVRRLAGAVPTPVSGSLSAADPAVKVHLCVVLDGGYVDVVKAKAVLNRFLTSQCPDDGSVVLSIVRHWYGQPDYDSAAGSGSTFGHFNGLADVVLPPTRVRLDKAAVTAAVNAIPPAVPSGLAWTTALYKAVDQFAAGAPSIDGVVDHGGARMAVFFAGSTPFITALGNPAPVSHTTAVQAFLSTTNLREASLFAFNASTADFSPSDPAHLFNVFTPAAPALSVTASSAATSLALSLHAATPGGAVTTSQMGDALGHIVKRRRDEWSVLNPTLQTTSADALAGGVASDAVYVSAYQAWPDPEAGWAFSVPATAAAESPIGAWRIYGVAAAVEIAARDTDAENWSYDGGNLLRLRLAEAGTVRLLQTAVDPRPLRGRYVTLAYSGRAVALSTKVELVLVLDGQEVVVDTAFSAAFGVRTRRTASYKIPKGTRVVAFGFRVSGRTDAAVGLSGVVFALGRYDFELPYTDAADDGALPAGTVVLYAGDACPAGFMQVPDSSGRLLYATTGDPGFFRRRFLPGAATNGTTYDVDLELICVVNTQTGQSTAAAKTTNMTWLTQLLLHRLPYNSRIRVTVVAGNSGASGVTVLSATLLDLDAKAVVAAALTGLAGSTATYAFGSRPQNIGGNMTAAAGLLAVGNARKRAVLTNIGIDADFTNTTLTGALATLTAVPRLAAVSAVVVGAQLASAKNVGAEALVYPAPATAEPGVLFAAFGGAPGPAPTNFWFNSPFQAGQYAAAVFAAEIGRLLSAIDDEAEFGHGAGVLDSYGGQAMHDHVADATGQALNETDVFDVASTEALKTFVPLPMRSQALVRPYPFGLYPTKRRPEDPPVYAVGIGHVHSVQTDMTSLPPAFPMRFCRKL